MIIDSHNHIGKRKGINFTAEEMIEWLDKVKSPHGASVPIRILLGSISFNAFFNVLN